MKFSVKINRKFISELSKKLEDIQTKSFTDARAKRVGVLIVNEMKDLISRGISPVKGRGKYEPYKAVRGKNKKGYPYSVQNKYPNKKISPVNLKLSGEQMKNLVAKTFKMGQGYGANVGYFEDESKKKESGHQEGVGGQPKRPTIPQPGESFAKVIENIINRFYKDIVEQELKKLK